MKAVRLAVLQWGSQWQGQDAPPVLRQQHDSCLHSETGGHQILDSVYQNSGTVKPIGSPSHSSNSNSSTGISQHDSRCVVQNEQSQSYRMATTTGDPKQSILCLGKPSGRHVLHSIKAAPIFVSVNVHPQTRHRHPKRLNFSTLALPGWNIESIIVDLLILYYIYEYSNQAILNLPWRDLITFLCLDG